MTEAGSGRVRVDKREAYNDTTVYQSTGSPLEDAIYTPLLPKLRTVATRALVARHCMRPESVELSSTVPQLAALALLRPGNAGLVPRAEGAQLPSQHGIAHWPVSTDLSD